MGYLQPETFFIRSMGVRTTPQTGRKGDEVMPDDFMRRMIRAVIESFPIDEAKKADMLQRIVGQKKKEEDQ